MATFKRYENYSGHIVGIFSADGGMMDYDVRIFQGSYDEMVISLHNIRYVHSPGSVQFTIPVKKADSMSIKINSASVGCDSGKAEDLIRFLHESYSDIYIAKMIQHLIFDHKKRRATPGL